MYSQFFIHVYKNLGTMGEIDASPSPPGDEENNAGQKDDGMLKFKKVDKKLEKLKKKYEKRGIVYISRLPPHLVRGCVDVLDPCIVCTPSLSHSCFYSSCRNLKSFVTCSKSMHQ